MAYNPSLWHCLPIILSKKKKKINIFKNSDIDNFQIYKYSIHIVKFIRIIDQYYDQNNSCDLRIN